MRTPALLAIGVSALLTGCLGSQEAYHPWKEGTGTRQPRPDPEKRAKEDAELKLETELPIEIARNEAEREKTKKALGRIMGDIPRNPWVSYERHMVSVLTRPHAEPYLPKGPPERVALALGEGAGAKPAATAEEGEEEDEEEEE